MAFDKNSRYVDQPTVEVRMTSGQRVQALKLRRLPEATGDPIEVKDHDRVDLLAHKYLGEGTRFWQLADANTELEANHLMLRVNEEQPRVIRVPKP